MTDALPIEFLSRAKRSRKKAGIAITVMGQFRLIVNNTDCTHLLTYDKVKLLLAILALSQGRHIARARLADMLWPDNHDNKGRARVRHALHTLRQAFAGAPDGLISNKAGLGVDPDQVWVDALHILDVPGHASPPAIKEKLALYAGPFLDGLKLPHSEPLLAWQQSWNARLELELAQYRSRLIDQYLDQNDTAAALAHAKQWVYQWPEDEACHRLLIRLLLASGDRDAALSAFQHCCDVLNKRLGVVPGTETRALLGLENHALSTQSLIPRTLTRESAYRPIAIVAIALAWKQDASRSADAQADEQAPEDALEIIHSWHKRLLTRARQHGAWLPHTRSTPILAHFGYPSLSERPITHAIRLAKDLARLDAPANVSVGLAIHADLALMDHAPELSLNSLLCQTVVPLAWDADHGEILLSPMAAARMADWPIETLRRTGRQYLRLNLKSGPAPVARMHGRLREFDTLIQLWTRHRQGHKPVAVQLTGVPGLGKSQLAQAMADYVRNVDGRVITLQSHENHNETPLHAVHPWLRTQLDLPDALEPSNWSLAQHEQAVADMQSRFRLAPEACHALLDTVLNRGDTLGDTCGAAIDAALAALHHHDDATQPVLITWDDTHWNDAASTTLLQKLMASEGTAIAMLVCTSRKATHTAPSVINIELGPLEATTIAEYVVHKTRKTKLSREARASLVSDSAGIPLYSKELLHLKALDLPSSTIPRISDMLSAQLLRLDPDTRRLAYLAALLPGLDDLTAMHVLGLNKNTLASSLDTLSVMGIVCHGDAAQVRCNSLTSRSIRRLMTQSEKQLLCGQIARYLVDQHQPAAVAALPVHRAHNASSSPWWHHAVHDALQHGSADTATQYIAHALFSGQIIDSTLRHHRHADAELTTLRGTPDAARTGTGASSPVRASKNAARQRMPANPETTLAALWGQWVIQHNLGNLMTGLHIARRLQQLAVNLRHDVWHGWSLYALAQHDLWTGDPVASESLLLQSLAAIQQGEGLDHTASSFGSHSYALGYATLGWAQALQGRYNTALQNTHYAIQLTSQTSSPASATACRLHLLRIHYLANNFKSLHAESTALLEQLPERSAGSVWSAIATAHTLLPLALKQPTAKILQTLKTALALVQNNMPVATDGYLCMLARCQIAMRNPDASIELLNQAAAIGQARQSRLLASEIPCIRGDAWAALQRPGLARQEWRKARTIAQQHSLFAYEEWANERLEALAD